MICETAVFTKCIFRVSNKLSCFGQNYFQYMIGYDGVKKSIVSILKIKNVE